MQPPATPPGRVSYSREPLHHPRAASERDWTQWWVGGGVFASAMFASGAFVGYRMQLTETGPTTVSLDKYVKKPHPFLKEPIKKKVAAPPINVTNFAARSLGIATVYCFAGFSFTITGIALVAGVRSPADAVEGLRNLQEWGPRFRKRCLAAIGIGESPAQLSSEAELREVAHLSAEEQFERCVPIFSRQ